MEFKEFKIMVMIYFMFYCQLSWKFENYDNNLLHIYYKLSWNVSLFFVNLLNSLEIDCCISKFSAFCSILLLFFIKRVGVIFDF